jgi:hypothetical protein
MGNKVSVKVEIPDGWELACDEVRQPLAGEHFINLFGSVVYQSHHCGDIRIIVRKSWQWPEWLKAGWIAMDEDGEWFAYSVEPEIKGNVWNPERGYKQIANLTVLDISPPTCTDWRNSLRKNPHHA